MFLWLTNGIGWYLRVSVFTNGVPAVLPNTGDYTRKTYPAPSTKMLKRVTLPDRRRQEENVKFDPREPLERIVFEGMQISAL